VANMGRLTTTQKARIKAALERGESRAKVRAAFGLTRSQVSYYARNYGVSYYARNYGVNTASDDSEGVQASTASARSEATAEDNRELLDMEAATFDEDKEADLCGACGATLNDRTPHCPFCGVALDWLGVQ
jgi:rubrerythrin